MSQPSTTTTSSSSGGSSGSLALCSPGEVRLMVSPQLFIFFVNQLDSCASLPRKSRFNIVQVTLSLCLMLPQNKNWQNGEHAMGICYINCRIFALVSHFEIGTMLVFTEKAKTTLEINNKTVNKLPAPPQCSPLGNYRSLGKQNWNFTFVPLLHVCYDDVNTTNNQITLIQTGGCPYSTAT